MTGDNDAEAVERAKERVFAEPDREVWVVERNPGSGWRVSAVLPTHEDAERYRDDLRTVLNNYPEEFPEEFKTDHTFRIRQGGRHSPTPMWESYPPEDKEVQGT